MRRATDFSTQDAMIPAPSGEQLRDDGMQRAVIHADEIDDSWSAKALRYVMDYAKSHPMITCEAVRAIAERDGLPVPPDRRAWGSVMTMAQKQKAIEWDSYTRAVDPKVHKNPVSLWRSLVAKQPRSAA